MKKERVFNIKTILGDTWEETERKIDMAREFCNVKNETMCIEIIHNDVTKFQLDHLRHGTVPFTSKLINVSDVVKFIDEDNSVRVIKNRNGAADATLS